MMIESYRDLMVWQKAMDIVADIYAITANFPREEIYGLTSQIRRSAISLPSNIAEGHAKGGRKEYAHFVGIAMGSLAELETQMLIAQRLKMLDDKQASVLQSQTTEIGKMLNVLRQKLTHGPNP